MKLKRFLCALMLLALLSVNCAYAKKITLWKTEKPVKAIVSTRYPVKASKGKIVTLKKSTWLKRVSKNVGKGFNGKYYKISDMSKISARKAKVRRCESGALLYSTKGKSKIALAKGTKVLVWGKWKNHEGYYHAGLILGGKFHSGVMTEWDLR